MIRLGIVGFTISRLSPSTAETLRHPQFSRFIIGITTANIGQFLQGLAVPFLVNDLTDSNAWVGASAAASMLPAVMITPIAGILSDRVDRKKLLVAAYAAQCGLSAMFTGVYLAGGLTATRIILIQILIGICAGFQWAPLQTMSPILVPPRLLVDAVRLVAISFTAGRAIGPAIAALILAFSGPGPAFAATLMTYIVALGFVSTVKTTWRPSEATDPFFQQFRSGIAYVRQRAGMRLAMLAQAMVAFFGAVFTFALTASIADDAYGVGGGGLGALAMAAGVGSIFASIYITGPGAAVRRSTVEAAAIAIYAGGVLIAAATPYLAVGMFGFTLLGVGHMLSAATLTTSLQVQVEENYRGRVMSVWLIVTLGSLPVAALVGGLLADTFSIRIVMAIFATMLMSFVAIRLLRADGFRSLDAQIRSEESPDATNTV